MNRQRITVAAIVAALAGIPAAALIASSAQAQDVPVTELFQKKCMTCHGPTAPANLKGPALGGVFGKSIASQKGYEYSDGLKAKASMKWTAANLDGYLTKPKEWAPGTKMAPSVGDPAQRKAIIDHLKTLK